MPYNDSCNQGEIVRALNVVVAELDKLAVRKSRPQPDNAGKPWTKDEEEQLTEEYRGGIAASEIAKLHNRSKGAITARLVRLGMVSDQYAVK